jgi:alkylation response protein AidB-like acyl-CoA dehydrogenase
MDLELTDEQNLLDTSIETLLERGEDADDIWESIVEFGGLMVGPGALGAIELCLIGRRLGEHLAAIPFLGSVAARYALLDSGELPDSFAALLEEPTAVAVAALEPGGDWSLTRNRTTLSDGKLDGEKCAVEQTEAADALLVPAAGADGPALALVETHAAGIRIAAQKSIDSGSPLSTVKAADVDVSDDRALNGTAAHTAVTRLGAIGALLTAAEANGASGTMLRMATEYAGQRRQFGRPIGSNQALRHILADMYTRQTSSWSSILYSAAALDGDAEDALMAASISKAYAAGATRAVAHRAIQVFGGIAFTEEHEAHLFLRRINLRGAQFGDADFHERLLGAALAETRRAAAGR